MKLSEKVVVVTGAGNGLGRQLVFVLLQKGAHVAAVDINVAGLQETQTQAGSSQGQLTLHRADIADRESVANLVDEVVAQHGCVDVVINNAGIIHPFETFADLDFTTIERVINVNLYGVINVSKAFLPLLQQRPKARVVNISSMGGLFPFPRQTLYCATKAAVKLLSEGMYAELSNSNVGVTVVFPGAIDTDIAKNCDANDAQIQKFKSLKLGIAPAEAAKQIVRAVEKERLHAYVGIDSKALSFLYRQFPNSAIGLMGKVMGAVLPSK